MTHDRDDLDLVHRVDHCACAAAATQLKASGSQGLERHPATTELFGNERRQRALLAQRIKRLLREARVAVDVLGVRRRDLLGDARDALQEGPIAVDGDGAFLESITSIAEDRKSTRLNSSHVEISYAVFCLKKKNKNTFK